jgi:hypothetical protein
MNTVIPGREKREPGISFVTSRFRVHAKTRVPE